MKEPFTPATEVELVRWMQENCYNEDAYSFLGHPIHEGYGLESSGPGYAWFYTERGGKNIEQHFSTEKEAVEYAFQHVRQNDWARSHCIGFTTDPAKAQELAGILKGLNLEFRQDKIPYYPDRPAYRTFVLGCAIQLSEHLKAIYYEVNR